jgi:hypothetical protein
MTSPDEHQHHDDESAMIKRAAQRYGTVGAMLAGGMVVFDKLLGRKPKEEAAIVVEASGEPGDIDIDGINFVLDDNTAVISPPPQARMGLKCENGVEPIPTRICCPKAVGQPSPRQGAPSGRGHLSSRASSGR